MARQVARPASGQYEGACDLLFGPGNFQARKGQNHSCVPGGRGRGGVAVLVPVRGYAGLVMNKLAFHATPRLGRGGVQEWGRGGGRGNSAGEPSGRVCEATCDAWHLGDRGREVGVEG